MNENVNEEELLKRHKQEKKELQSRIQSIKKSVAKGDKKKKKEIADQIGEWEKELEDKHNQELNVIKSTFINEIDSDGITCDPENDVKNESEIIGDPEDEPEDSIRVSRAQRRRNKKASEEKEREKRILELSEKSRDGPRVKEMNLIKEALKPLGLALYDIAADGNCLYCAINHQLDATGRESFSVSKLRKLTANFMRENKDDFLPFMYNESDEPVSEEYFEEYCKEVANTKLWGGQLELRALSNILTCPIKIIQASGPPTLQGENFKAPELILTYHRHLYRLGEHYNSTVFLERNDS